MQSRCKLGASWVQDMENDKLVRLSDVIETVVCKFNALMGRGDDNITLIDVSNTIVALSDIPAVDAEPVVRCKDCENSKPWYRDKSRCFLWDEVGIDVFNDGFCSYGIERKNTE